MTQTINGTGGHETLTGTDPGVASNPDGIDIIYGNGGFDQLNGLGGDDQLDGGDDLDYLEGGAGADALQGGAGQDFATYLTSAGGVTVNLATGTGAGSDAQGDTLAGIENLVGSAHNDDLTGGAGRNSLTGNAGDDTLDGGDGNDALRGEAGADVLQGGTGVDMAFYDGGSQAVTINLAAGTGTGGDAEGDTLSGIESLFGTDFADRLTGDAGTNLLRGSSGDDILAGLGGADQLDGVTGIDTATYGNSAAAVQVSLASGTGTGGDAQGDTCYLIENLVGSNFNDFLIGDAGANSLTGGDGDDTIQSGAGNDVVSGGNGNDLIAAYGGTDAIDGGAGIDTVYYDSSTVGVFVNLATGTGTGGDAQGDTLTGIENLVGSSFNDFLIGDGGANDLRGDVGDDTIRGGAGADRIGGGAGVDTADYAGSAVGVTIDLVAGTGTGGDAQGDTLFSIENVTGSSFADKLYGDGGSNALTGGVGNDELYGGAGADVLNGGTGTDAAGYFSSGAAVTVDLAAGTGTGGDAQGDVLSNIENLGGSVFNDILTGNAGINAINGGGGNDSIAGAAGSDALYGGNGNDQIDGGADGDALSGAAGTDTLAGGAGNDAINGGADADAIDGGAGIDIADYNGSGVGVTVNLATNINTGGYAQGDTLTNVENVQGSAFGDTLTGDGAANTLWGMAGNDGLNGGAGWDTLEGGNGDDQLVGGAGGDILRGGAGADHLTGGADYDTASYWDSTVGVTINLLTGVNTGGTAQGDTIDSDIEIINGSNHNDVMTGNALANELVGFDGIDTLSGGGGSDTLRGGAGADVLTGGSGVDNFSYTAVSDSTVSAADTIQDFQAGDLIWVRTIDADGNSGNGDTAFSFIGAGAFSGTAGELRVVTSGAIQVVSADVNGDATADFVLNVTSDHALTAGDFLL
jgi:Ca2+-binding RTX toxin-like protein